MLPWPNHAEDGEALIRVRDGVRSDPATGASLADIEARVLAVERSPRFQSLVNRVPARASRRSIILVGVLFLIPWIALFGTFAVAYFTSIPGPYFLRSGVFSIAVLVGGESFVVRLIQNPPGWRLAPLARFSAVIADKRAESEGGKWRRTWYCATLASGSEPAAEFAVDRELYDRLNPGAVGMAFARGDKLHEFMSIKA